MAKYKLIHGQFKTGKSIQSADKRKDGSAFVEVSDADAPSLLRKNVIAKAEQPKAETQKPAAK